MHVLEYAHMYILIAGLVKRSVALLAWQATEGRVVATGAAIAVPEHGMVDMYACIAIRPGHTCSYARTYIFACMQVATVD